MSASGLRPADCPMDTYGSQDVARLRHRRPAGFIAKNPATRTKFPPMRRTTHTYPNRKRKVARSSGRLWDSRRRPLLILAYSGLRFGRAEPD